MSAPRSAQITESLAARARRIDPALRDGAIAAGLAVLALAILGASPATAGTAPTWLAVALILGASLPLAIRRGHPIAVLAVTAAAAAIGAWFGANLNVGGFGLLVALGTVALECDRRVSLTVLALIPFYLLAIDRVYLEARPAPPGTVAANFIGNLLVFGFVWVAGDMARGRRERTAALEERAARLEREQADAARRAVAEERALIARELHDVVAHSVSVMVVQAGAARRVLDEHPDQARDALGSIEATGRAALVEMRRLLGVLRTEDEPAQLGPQRGLDGLGELVAQAGSSGLPVELVVEGTRPPLEPGVELAAYRIVQEALTNAIRHGGGRARVRVGYRNDSVELAIEDDGRLDGGARAGIQSPTGVGPSGTGLGRLGLAGAPGRGHGIVGMRERAAFFGGSLEAGPRPGGGFEVRARLPAGARS